MFLDFLFFERRRTRHPRTHNAMISNAPPTAIPIMAAVENFFGRGSDNVTFESELPVGMAALIADVRVPLRFLVLLESAVSVAASL